jgi:hypothetical protein
MSRHPSPCKRRVCGSSCCLHTSTEDSGRLLTSAAHQRTHMPIQLLALSAAAPTGLAAPSNNTHHCGSKRRVPQPTGLCTTHCTLADDCRGCCSPTQHQHVFSRALHARVPSAQLTLAVRGNRVHLLYSTGTPRTDKCTAAA